MSIELEVKIMPLQIDGKDSDLDDDDSPEFKACIALNRAIEFAEGSKGRTARFRRARSNT